TERWPRPAGSSRSSRTTSRPTAPSSCRRRCARSSAATCWSRSRRRRADRPMAFNEANYKKFKGYTVPADFRPAAPTKEAREWFYGGIILRAARGYMRFQGLDLTIEGAENIPLNGGAMIAVNHTGYFDFVYCGIAAFLNGRDLVLFMAKQEFFDHKIAGPLMRKMKHIPVDRAAGRGAYEEAVRRLRGGALVGIFPEATISRSFEIKEFKTGNTRMAHDAGDPVIPVTIF